MFFIALFTLEMLLKMYSLGLQVIIASKRANGYIHNNYFRATLCPYLIVLIASS